MLGRGRPPLAVTAIAVLLGAAGCGAAFESGGGAGGASGTTTSPGGAGQGGGGGGAEDCTNGVDDDGDGAIDCDDTDCGAYQCAPSAPPG
jgi:hypothetical protein